MSGEVHSSMFVAVVSSIPTSLIRLRIWETEASSSPTAHKNKAQAKASRNHGGGADDRREERIFPWSSSLFPLVPVRDRDRCLPIPLASLECCAHDLCPFGSIGRFCVKSSEYWRSHCGGGDGIEDDDDDEKPPPYYYLLRRRSNAMDVGDWTTRPDGGPQQDIRVVLLFNPVHSS
jgi:hypothetical protein